MVASLYCRACGTRLPAESAFCPACGASQATGDQAPTNAPALFGTGRLPAGRLLRQRYRLLHALGQGGMGAVYVAHDTQLGDRLVAVKEMGMQRLTQQDIPLAEAVQQFQQEAHLLASLHHPSLPVIHEYFQEDARWYLVMSFIEGQTLQAALDAAPEKKFSVHEVVRIGLELCKVLDYLHTHEPQIIFRDLKPSNIMLTPKGQIYLIDFGIARHFKQEKSADTAYYSSIGYSPIEQYGHAQTSPRSDLYSLGATLHQMLSGHNPSDNPFQFANLQIIDPTLPVPLTQLITNMLEMQEQNRPASAIAVQALLVQTQLESMFKPASSVPTIILPTPPILPPLAPVVKSEAMKLLRMLTSHTGYVYSVAWSPDGQMLASGSSDRTIKLWDVQTQQLFLTLTGHTNYVFSLAWSPDGRTLASGSWDKTIKLWNVQTQQLFLTLTGHTSDINSVAWSADKQALASSSVDKTIKVWNTQTGGLLRTLTDHTGIVYSVAWNVDGQTLASGSSDQTIRLWNAQTGQLLRILTGHRYIVRRVVWSADGQALASSSEDKTIKVWDTQNGQLLYTLTGHTGAVCSLAWSADGQTLASGSEDKTIKLWNTQNGQLLRTLTGHTGTVHSVAWNPNGQRLASGSFDKTIRIWG